MSDGRAHCVIQTKLHYFFYNRQVRTTSDDDQGRECLVLVADCSAGNCPLYAPSYDIGCAVIALPSNMEVVGVSQGGEFHPEVL